MLLQNDDSMLMIFDDGRWLLGGKRVVVIQLNVALCCQKEVFCPSEPYGLT